MTFRKMTLTDVLRMVDKQAHISLFVTKNEGEHSKPVFLCEKVERLRLEDVRSYLGCDVAFLSMSESVDGLENVVVHCRKED